MRYISLFAGIGGFDLALNRLGHECVYANEWDKYAAQIYNKNFKLDELQGKQVQTLRDGGSVRNATGQTSAYGCIDTRDITTVPTSEIPDHELLVGGFPCQAFSVAGKRRGFDDTRGTLFFEIARILKDKQPKLFILENVKGLLSHDNGNTFKVIISTLTELGYDLQWQVVNSKNFGVPQNRERVFIVGHLRGERRPEVFPIREGYTGDNEIKLHGEEATRPCRNCKNIEGRRRCAMPMRWVRTEKGKEYRKEAMKHGKDLTPFNEGYRELVESKEDVTGCLTSALQKDALLQQNHRIRRLTPIECERLQGFPDGWTEGISDTQRYKCLGNAVTVNVVYEIAKRL